MQSDAKVSSLERFVKTRGVLLSGTTPSSKNLLIQFWIGLGLIVAGLAVLLVALISGHGSIAFGAIGPLTAGFINMFMALYLKKKLVQAPPPAVAVTPEARKMLSALAYKYIWSKNSWMRGQQTWMDPAMQAQLEGYQYWNPAGGLCHENGLKSLPDTVWDRLEEAAFHYNRTVGAIEASASGGSLHRLAPRIIQGADEAILDVMHQAQMVSKFPEGLGTIQTRLENSVGTLRELGDRVEALVLREPSFTERLSSRSSAEEILDELRLEQAAFSELSSPAVSPQTESPLRQNLQG
jgi:hypothetical protein